MSVRHEEDLHRERRRALLELLRDRPAANQLELVELLAERGIEATQSSVSRDLRYLGVAKVGGRYVAPPAPAAEQAPDLDAIGRFVEGARSAGPHLTVLQTALGAAQTVAVAIDRARFSEVVGTLAGDDTIFIATANASDQRRFLARLDLLLGADDHA